MELLLRQGASATVSDINGDTCLIDACKGAHLLCVKVLLRLGTVQLRHSTSVPINVAVTNVNMENALLVACRVGSKDIVGLLLEHNASIPEVNLEMIVHRDNRGDDCVIVSCRHGHRDLALSFLKYGASVNSANNGGETALMAACLNGHLETARMLISHDSTVVLAEDLEGNTAIMYGVRSGNVHIVKLLLSSRVSMSPNNREYSNRNGDTALHIAAQCGYDKCLETLLSSGLRVDKVNKNGEGPLFQACEAGQLNCVAVLIAHGANINLATEEGVTALMEASRHGYALILNLLFQHFVTKDLTAKNGYNALHFAAAFGQDQVLEILMGQLGIESRTASGDTALLIACIHGQVKCISVLLDLGADIMVKDKLGNNLLMIACIADNCDVAEVLIKRGNLLNIVNSAGNNALIESAIHRCINSAVLLLKHGAELTFKNSEGKTAYEYCALQSLLLPTWWKECAEPVSITGAVGPCAYEINGVYEPNDFENDPDLLYSYTKRLSDDLVKLSGRVIRSPQVMMQLTPNGITIQKKQPGKKAIVLAKLNYKDGLPENNKKKRWEVAREVGMLWTSFDKQDSVKAWSKSQILALCEGDIRDEYSIIQRFVHCSTII